MTENIILYYSKCGTCRKAEKWLLSNNIPFTIRPIKEQNPTQQELKLWLDSSKLKVNKFFNTSGLLYRSLDVKSKINILPEQELLSMLASDGMLVKRPILLTKNRVLIGFNEQEWAEVFQV